ncbi:MAG TPA: hypothetical protein EYO73_00360 [Sulfurimonas sp.]|nr:hypothetical protein [Sulfurimonas sp.]
MYLSCPNCLTSYNIGYENIDINVRAVRCSNCGYTWQQYPVLAAPTHPRESQHKLPSFPPKEDAPHAQFHRRNYQDESSPPQAPPSLTYPEPDKVSSPPTSKPAPQVGTTSKFSLSQCVFCRSASGCNGGIINRLSGRLHH